MRWTAKWIWGGSESSPRNEWRCFRKTFVLNSGDWEEGMLSISADSRYVLYVNGTRVGRGPSRSWPSEQSFDTHEVGHLLKAGMSNTIAVLVQHYGVSNFYYIRGRGGLLAQLDLRLGQETVRQVATDDTWRTSRHEGQGKRVQRMSSQQGFVERIDARLWDEQWIEPDFNDGCWTHACIVGEVGTAPWTALLLRTIPPLAEETVYPSRVESLSQVVPIPWTGCIDLRNHMIPGSETDANATHYAGYVATLIRTGKPAKAVIGLLYALPILQGAFVNGVYYPKKKLKAVQTQRYVEVDLQSGDNLLMIVLAGSDHSRGLFIGVDCSEPFELVSPVGVAGDDVSPFVSIGPFISYEYLDHQYGPEEKAKQRVIEACAAFGSDLPDMAPEAAQTIEWFRAVGQSAGADELDAYSRWIRPISNTYVSEESVFAHAIWKKQSIAMPVPAALQHLTAAHAVPSFIPVYEEQDTEIIVDFGRQGSGYIQFKVEAEAGTVLDFYGFEHMHEGWIQYTTYLDNSLRYICREGHQQYTSNVRRGFRYLMVTVRGARTPVKITGIQLLQSHYPVAETGRFLCPDQTLNEIWRISRHTAKLCMEDTFVDCPAYEQTFWVGDSRNEALISYYLFGGEELVKRCLELVPGSASQTPLYADQVPSGFSSVIPNWTFFWVNACEEYYERTGDRSFAAGIWPHVAYTLDHYLKLLNENGLLSLDAWNFLDWAPIDQPREGIVTHQNMFLVKALQSAAELGGLAGDGKKASQYRETAERLSAAINRHLWQEEKQAYLDCIHSDGRPSDIFSMQTQVVAILCGIPNGERKEMLMHYLVSPPSGFVPIGSPFMSFFYYEALAQADQHRYMVDDMRRQYGQMLDYEATTCWEMYPKMKEGRIDPYNLTRSHCHAWSAAPGYFLGAYVLGVQSTAPGMRKVKIEPHPCGLEWARGSVPLPGEGRIDVSWRMEEDSCMLLRVWLPAAIEAEVRLPVGVEGNVEIYRLGE
ncbi:family 78 glycoside hydrolase catalytic domain [Paenibacillus mendelii]|uniref:Family 78 glycoside hydrolase catalytic domain n=1 Tax=Paenibacillus mendelii TaxID=206163 RepID=A0ABV6J9J9_9BACL|nr:family 78 glycoside hydrolase catalytic domain [Paenibacillus mendelii]MCQ6563892.1 glycoside hydrolase family 78 protein [Paenibacillus mendelii]